MKTNFFLGFYLLISDLVNLSRLLLFFTEKKDFYSNVVKSTNSFQPMKTDEEVGGK